jgi:hypothetical protein
MELIGIAIMALHILCATALVGGALLWRFGAIPGVQLLEPETRAKVDNAVAAAWRPAVIAAILGVLVSGIYNFVLVHGGLRSPRFHMVFGIKMLLVLHVFAVTLLATRANNPRRSRQLTGVVLSGIVILILSVVLGRV